MKKKSSLRVQLISILLIFVVAILGLVYVFQTTLLDDFYNRSKAKQLQHVAERIELSLQDDDLIDVLDEMNMSNEVCARVISNNPKYDILCACSLKNLDVQTINNIISETAKNGKEKLFKNYKYQRSKDLASQSVLMYSKMIEFNNDNIEILVSSSITPLNATIATIKSQYIVIVSIVIVASVILALIISRFILRPINQINDESKKLSKGKYDSSKVNASSKEVNELNQTLQIANQDIKAADKAKKELLGNVSHDLRTPLTMIVGYGEMIRDIKEENNADNINIIIDEAKRLSSLVDDLIDISRLDDGKIELHKESVSINDLLTSVYHQYEKYCEAQEVDFVLDLKEDYFAELDVLRIKQVLYNFINNALNYNDKIDKKIILGQEVKDGKRYVYVYDNGQGISKEDINNIWDRYYKVDKTHVRHHIGSGIGLSLSRDLLLAHKLVYGVESKIDEYCKFYFVI